MMRVSRSFSLSRDEMVALAIDRASDVMRSVFAVVEKSGQLNVSLEGAAGSAGLLAVAHTAFKEALHEVEYEHEQFEAVAVPDDAAYVSPLFNTPDLTRPPGHLYSVPPSVTRIRGRKSPLAPPLTSTSVIAPGGTPGGMHPDGSLCRCEPGCDCHPSARDEDALTTGERGSWHLDTCPLSPKNRGMVKP